MLRVLRPVAASIGLLGAALLSCTPAIDSVERPRVLHPVFDPATADLPTPNDLALAADGKVLISAQDALSPAENALKLSMNGYAGFSAGSSARVRFTGALAPGSLTEQTALALDLGEGGTGAPVKVEVTREYSPCDASLSLAAPKGLIPGHTYLFAIRGGANGAKGEGGEELAATPAFHLLRAGKDLREHLDALPGATREERRATAERLEAVRAKLEPYFKLLVEQGLQRSEIAVLWAVTVRKDGEALFNPATKQIPFPNDLLRDAKTGLVSLPIDPADSPESQTLKRGLSKLDGFSTQAALTVEFSRPLTRSTVVAGQTVRLFRRDTGEEHAELDAKLSEDGKKLSAVPRVPLRPGTPYVLVLSGLTDALGPLAQMPLTTLLSLPHPVADAQGHSLVSSLCDESAARLEALRKPMQPVLDKVGREHLAVAYTFTTQDIFKRVQALRAAPYQANLPLALTEVVSKTPAELGLLLSGQCFLLPPTRVKRVITGKLTTLDFLDPVTRAFRENGAGVPASIPFLLTVPDVAEGVNVPVVVFGHGLSTERRFSLFLAERLARAGMATIAIDFPFHGERTACLQDSHCASGAACAADGACIKDGQRADLARLPAIWPGLGPGVPTATGAAFIDVPNLFGSRDHFRQALVDLSALTRLLRGMDWRPVMGGVGVDTRRIHYTGISLGSIIGASAGGMDPTYARMLLNVGGAGLVGLMRESNTFGPTLRQGLADKGISEGTPQYDAFVGGATWVLDEVDPINLSRYAVRELVEWPDPLTGQPQRPAPKKLHLQMATGDTVVPNTSTQRLLAATGVNRDSDFSTFIGTHAFLSDPVEPAFCPGQSELSDFLVTP